MHDIITDIKQVPEHYVRLNTFKTRQSTLSVAATEGRIRAVKLVKKFGQKGGAVFVHPADAKQFLEDHKRAGMMPIKNKAELQSSDFLHPDLSKYPPGSVIPGDPKNYTYPEPETIEVKLLKEINGKLDELLARPKQGKLWSVK